MTEETASEIEGRNKSRPEWGCQYGKDTAKGGAVAQKDNG